MGVTGAVIAAVENPHLTGQFSAYSDSQPKSGELHRSTELWSVEKKCAYEWTHTAETHAARGSTVRPSCCV